MRAWIFCIFLILTWLHYAPQQALTLACKGAPYVECIFSLVGISGVVLCQKHKKSTLVLWTHSSEKVPQARLTGLTFTVYVMSLNATDDPCEYAVPDAPANLFLLAFWSCCKSIEMRKWGGKGPSLHFSAPICRLGLHIKCWVWIANQIKQCCFLFHEKTAVFVFSERCCKSSEKHKISVCASRLPWSQRLQAS